VERKLKRRRRRKEAAKSEALPPPPHTHTHTIPTKVVLTRVGRSFGSHHLFHTYCSSVLPGVSIEIPLFFFYITWNVREETS
jgi:hypothetical protein